MSLSCIWVICVICVGSSLWAAEIIYADGRREPAKELRKDSKGEFTVESEGRRVAVKKGEVAAVIDDEGKETETIPPLGDGPDPPEATAALASLRDPKNPAWFEAAQELGRRPTRSLHDALVVLASDRSKELRKRAIGALAWLRTKESTLSATSAILAEKDTAVRREAASSLFAVQEIFKRCDSLESVKAGLADKDGGVRIVFAMLAPDDFEAAIPVLKSDGLKNSDHHVRESAALELGRRGDGSGESVLVGMLARKKLPGFDGGDELMERYLVKEQVEVCAILGKLGTESAKAALAKAKASPHEAVRKAAEAALAGTAAK